MTLEEILTYDIIGALKYKDTDPLILEACDGLYRFTYFHDLSHPADRNTDDYTLDKEDAVRKILEEGYTIFVANTFEGFWEKVKKFKAN